MTHRGRSVLVLAALAASLVLAAQASAHAYLVKTVPAASGILNVPPSQVALTYDEAVEPKFALISVSDAAGHQETTGPVARSPSNPDTLVVPLRPHLPQGWYLVYWRAISVDGHPVQGAFTYAIGPSPGPAPVFPIPHLSATATTTPLLVARWAMFLLVMVSFGLFVLRIAIARPVAKRLSGAPLRAVSVAFVVASVGGLIAIPAYLDIAIANDSLRGIFDIGGLAPLYRATAFGRSYADMELCFALFCAAAWVAIWLDQPRRPQRSIAELTATTGALLAGLAVLVVPGAAGHAAQTSPRTLSLVIDWLHLVSGSLWLGGLIGLLVLWRSLGSDLRVPAFRVAIPRFSRVAFASVVVLIGSGTVATVFHMPALNALWETSYGKAILVKIGLVALAMPLAALNFLRAKPRLAAAETRPELGASTVRMLRALMTGEALLITGAVFAAAVLSSLAPPPPAFALQNSALARVGPGRVTETVHKGGYTLQVLITPNRAAAPDSFALKLTRGGKPVRGAVVTLAFNHLEMQMPQQEYALTEKQPGIYSRSTPALIMVGKWGLSFEVTPKSGLPFTALVVDEPSG